VDRQGRLVGIVVGTDREGERGGWTYAVDVGHVRRLLRAEQAGKVVILRARRPIVGLVLGAGPEPDQVVVQRVTPGGPAEQAGIKQGDVVLAADGLNIRSVYQAVVPLLKKQAGDTMTFLVEQADGRRTIEVTLRGGVELPGPHFAGALGLVDPQVEVARVAKNRFDVRDRRGGVRNLAVEPQQPEASAEEEPGVRLLQKALDQYTTLIERYREELQRRDREQAASRAVIESLQAEIADLKRKLDHPAPPSGESPP
jgi:membrane-associated protease RseP (regulator of RpoE activity)